MCKMVYILQKCLHVEVREVVKMAVFAVPSNKAHVVSNKQFEAMKRPDAETVKRTEKAAVRFAARCNDGTRPKLIKK